MVSYDQKVDALKCVPSIVIDKISTSLPGVSNLNVRMSFLFGSTSSRYYDDMNSAVDGSYSHLRTTVYEVCHIVERER